MAEMLWWEARKMGALIEVILFFNIRIFKGPTYIAFAECLRKQIVSLSDIEFVWK